MPSPFAFLEANGVESAEIDWQVHRLTSANAEKHRRTCAEAVGRRGGHLYALAPRGGERRARGRARHLKWSPAPGRLPRRSEYVAPFGACVASGRAAAPVAIFFRAGSLCIARLRGCVDRAALPTRAARLMVGHRV